MKYADRVEDSANVTGTASLTLAGTPAIGMQSFASAFAVGQKNIPFVVKDSSGAWEAALGTLSGSATLTRDAFLASSTGSKISFSAGTTKTVTCTLPATVMQSVSVDPDDVGFDIILLAGQSNMMGVGTLDSLIDVSDSRVWVWGAKPSDSARYQKIIQAIDPLPYNDTNSGTTGPGSWLGRAYAASIPAHRHILLVPIAVGGTGILYSSDWSYPSGSLYTAAIAQTNAALAAAQAIYQSSRVVGIAWLQGEAESSSTSYTAANYKTAWKSMMDGLKLGITGAASAWVVIGQMCPEFIADTATRPNAGAIDGAHQALPAEYANTAFVAGPSGMDNGDAIHYSAAGARVLGSRMGLAAKSARFGLSYLATPVVPGAPIIGTASAGNAQATVTFSPPASNGGAAITAYTVTSSPGGFTASGSASPLTVTGLTNGAAYTFTVTATNSVGIGPASSASNSVTPTVGATAPGQVTGLTLGTATSTTQPLTWTAPSDGGSSITDYVVQYALAGSGSWTTFADGTSTTAGATVTGLSASTSYDYRVAAVNTIGLGTNSSTATGSTASAGTSYTTLNPSDKDAGITLSGGNLTFAKSGGPSFPAVRGISSKTSGKYYFEVTVTSLGVFIGIGNASASTGSFPGGTADSMGFWTNNSVFYIAGNTTGNPIGTVAAGDVVSVVVDLDADTIKLRKNDGVWNTEGYSTSGVSGAIYPMLGSSDGGQGTVNFGATAFVHTVPEGHSGWTA